MTEDEIKKVLLGLRKETARVLFYVSRGKSNKEAAERLNIDEKTINYHMNIVYSKLDYSKETTLEKRDKFMREVAPIFRNMTFDIEEIEYWPPTLVPKIPLETSQEPPQEPPSEPPQPTPTIPSPPPPRFRITRTQIEIGVGIIVFFIIGILIGRGCRPAQVTDSRPTNTFTPTYSATFTSTPTITITPTPPYTPTITNTPTVIPTPTITNTPTITPTRQPTSTSTATKTPPPDGILFIDDFEAGLSEQWNVVMGETYIVNGDLISKGNSMLTIGESDWENYSIELLPLNNHRPYQIGVHAKDANNMIVFEFNIGFENRQFFSRWYIVKDGKWEEVPGSYAERGGWGLKPVTIEVNNGVYTAYFEGNKLSSFVLSKEQTGFVVLKLSDQNTLEYFKITYLP